MTLINTAEAIRCMQIRGAGRIARAAAGALSEHASTIQADDLDSFILDMEEAALILSRTRPTAVSLPNAIHLVMKNLRNATGIEDARNTVIRDAEAFIRSSERAVVRIGAMGANLIRDGDCVMTHCNSEAALACIIEAKRQGKDIEVFATEVRPWNQGLLTIEVLNHHEIPTYYIVDSAVRACIRDVDLVITGADAVCADGTVVNKIGTSQIALIAHESRKRMVVAAETYKFAPRTILGFGIPIEERPASELLSDEIAKRLPFVTVRNPVFDLTSPEHIDLIVTEAGVVAPASALSIIREYLGWDISNFEDIFSDPAG